MLLLLVAGVAVPMGLGRRWDRFAQEATEHETKAEGYARSAAFGQTKADLYDRIAENANPAWTASLIGRGQIEDPKHLREFVEEFGPQAAEYRATARRSRDEATTNQRLADQESREAEALRARW